MIPYSDELMRFENGRYCITEKALTDIGIDLRGRIARRKASSPEFVINSLLRLASSMVYEYIHRFSLDNDRQDCILASVPEVRGILFDAMLAQAQYILMNGDLSRSEDKAKRELAIDPHAVDILNRNIPNHSCSILYVGA